MLRSLLILFPLFGLCTRHVLSRRTGVRNKIDKNVNADSLAQSIEERLTSRVVNSGFPKFVWESHQKTPEEPDFDACARIGTYELPPLTLSAFGLTAWCQSTWPVERKYTDLHDCSEDPENLKETSQLMEPGAIVSVPTENAQVDYFVKKKFGGGINNQGTFLLEKAPDQNSSLPEFVVLKVAYDIKGETQCLRATRDIDGFPDIYSSTFHLNDRCYKGIVMTAVAGEPWANHYPLEAKDECALQEETGRLMCGLLQRSFAELDWNNPGNWHMEKLPNGETKFHRIDLGLCSSFEERTFSNLLLKIGFGDGNFSKYEKKQSFGAGGGVGMMWRPTYFAVHGKHHVHLGAGDLILNSQKRVRELIEEPPKTIVSFPGDFVSQLGGTDWDPTQQLCEGQTSDNGNTYDLHLPSLQPGSYHFKVVLHSNWKYEIGERVDKAGNHVQEFTFTVSEGEHVRLRFLRNIGNVEVADIEETLKESFVKP